MKLVLDGGMNVKLGFIKIIAIVLLIAFSTQLTASIVVKDVDFSDLPLIKVLFGSSLDVSRTTPIYEDNSRVNVKTLEATARSMIRPIDIVFVIDTSGSMDDKIELLRRCSSDIVSSLQGLDYRVAVTGFGDPGRFRIYRMDNLVFVKDAADVEFLIRQSIRDDLGGNEAQIEALFEATKLPFRSNTMRLLVLITDEDTSQARINIDLYGPLLDRIVAQEIRVVSLLGSYRSNPATKDLKYKEISDKSGGFVLDLDSLDIVSSVKSLAFALTNEYKLEYQTNYKYYDGRTVELKIGNQSMLIEFPKKTASIKIGSNLSTSVYIDSKSVGRTNQTISHYQSFVPVNLKVGSSNVVARSFSFTVQDIDVYYDLAPKSLSYKVSPDSRICCIGSVVDGLILGVPLGGLISDLAEIEMLPTMLVTAGVISLFSYFRCMASDFRDPKVTIAVNSYNAMVKKHYDGSVDYSELVTEFQRLQKTYERQFKDREITW